MSAGAIGFLLFIVTSVISSIICHRFIRMYLVAIPCAVVMTHFLFHFFIFVHEGTVDKLALIAVIFSTPIVLVIAIVTGIPFWLARRRDMRKKTGHCRFCGYDLTGNRSGRCPECGNAFATRE